MFPTAAKLVKTLTPLIDTASKRFLANFLDYFNRTEPPRTRTWTWNESASLYNTDSYGYPYPNRLPGMEGYPIKIEGWQFLRQNAMNPPLGGQELLQQGRPDGDGVSTFFRVVYHLNESLLAAGDPGLPYNSTIFVNNTWVSLDAPFLSVGDFHTDVKWYETPELRTYYLGGVYPLQLIPDLDKN